MKKAPPLKYEDEVEKVARAAERFRQTYAREEQEGYHDSAQQQEQAHVDHCVGNHCLGTAFQLWCQVNASQDSSFFVPAAMMRMLSAEMAGNGPPQPESPAQE
jgi:hypothetical protein